jgi:hypothetical protein
MNLVQTSETTIRANTKPIVNELTALKAELDQLTEKQKEFGRGSKAYKEMKPEIEAAKNALEAMQKTMGVTGMSVKQLTEEQRRLTKEFNEFGTGGERLFEVNTRYKELTGAVKASSDEIKKSEGLLGNLKQWIVGAFTIGAILEFGRAMIDFGKSVFDVGAKFEKYEVVLTKAFGSQELAKKSMAELQKLAAQTPFTLDELTGSYVKFINRGLMPSMESMTKLGDLAASQGKGFDQLTEAILDAGTGEFERLKEFGISAEKSGDQVELSFKGVHKTVKLTPEAMQGAIESFGELDTVSGMMAETMKTGEGNLSNINDKIDAIKVGLYNGLLPVFSTLFKVVNTGWDIFKGFANVLMAVPNFVRENKDVFIGLAAAIATLNYNGIINNATVLRATILEKGRAAATAISNGVTILLNNTVRANPIMAMVSGVMLLVTALVAWYNRSEKLRANLSGLWEMLKVLGTAFVDFYSGLLSFNPAKMAAAFTGLGDKLSKAFNKGYDDSMKVSKAAAAIEKQKEDAESKRAAAELAAAQAKLAADAKLKGQSDGHTKLSAAEKKHLDSEGKKQEITAEKSAEEYLKIREKLNDSLEKINEEFIDDDWKRKENAILREYQNTLAANKKTLAEFEGSIEQKKKLEEEYANFELALYGKVEKDLLKLAQERQTAEDKIIEESRKTWKTVLDKKGADIIALNQKLKKDGDDLVHDEAEKAKNLADRRKEMFQSLIGFVNESFNNTIQALESIDTAYAQSQAERIKGVQAGFNQIAGAITSMKLDIGSVLASMKGDGVNAGLGLGESIASGLGAAFTANPVAFIGAAKKLVDGVNGVLEANKWYNISMPLKKIIAESKQAIEDFGVMLKMKISEIEEEGERLMQKNNENRDKMTAAALDFEAEQFSILVENKEDLKAINDEYSAEELRIKALYADQLNSKDEETAAKARAIVAGLLHDLKVNRNDNIENLIVTERTKREIQAEYLSDVKDINKQFDDEIAELQKTASTRTLEEQASLIAAVEARRTAALAKEAGERQDALVDLMGFKEREQFIISQADAAILEVKKNANNLSIDEQQRLIDAIKVKRDGDLLDLRTSEDGIKFIKDGTATSIKGISEKSAADELTINANLKAKQKQAEWQHNAEVYAAQLAAFNAEKELTIAMLRLQYIKAQGKIFSKSEMKAIEAALAAAYSSMPPMPPAGFFNYPSGGASGGTGGGNGIGGADNVMKYENGGFFPMYGETMAKYANGGLVYGPSHRQGGVHLIDSRTGQKRGEMEGEEFIVNKRATRANLGLLHQINNTGMANRLGNSNFSRTGRPYFEDGGVFSTFPPITLNQSNSLADATFNILEAIAKATGATQKATEITALNTDATAKNTNALVDPIRESASNSRNLGSIASATRDTANKNFAPNISIINQQLELFRNIEAGARL